MKWKDTHSDGLPDIDIEDSCIESSRSIMESLHENTKRRAYLKGQKDAQNGAPCESNARGGSMWDVEYKRGFNQISECGCRFENHHSNSVVLCQKCSKLPCFNRD